MPRIDYAGASCELQDGETVLDGLLRHGLSVPHACKAGSCGSCLLHALPPSRPPIRSQEGLKAAWQARGYFLACLCRPDEDLVVGVVGADARVAATITALERLTDSVLRVRLATPAPFEYRAGQFITVLRADGLARSYSVASLPTDHSLELHVRLLPDGCMSQWLVTTASVGTVVQIQGPSGDCFYLAGREDQPLLLAGTGTGLAPLLGIARDALGHGHRGPLHLFHGAMTRAGFYLQQQLAELASAHQNFRYTLTTLEDDGPIDRTVFGSHPSMSGWRAYVCGDPSIVHSLKKKIFLAGAALHDIHADAFLPSAPPGSG
jgi:ferredoxin-NADP reductase/ferredoxin